MINNMHYSYSNTKINLILDGIKEYKKRKKNTRNKMEAILDLRALLIKHNYPNQLIYSKIIDILNNYDISPRYIKYLLDYYVEDPTRITKFYESGDIFSSS